MRSHCVQEAKVFKGLRQRWVDDIFFTMFPELREALPKARAKTLTDGRENLLAGRDGFHSHSI